LELIFFNKRQLQWQILNETYIISGDYIRNKPFFDEQSYFDFIIEDEIDFTFKPIIITTTCAEVE